MNKALSIFNQLRPISIGFDDVFSHFEKIFEDDLYITAGNYPPYNIVKTGSQRYNIEVALAGYSKKDINVDFAEGLLTIKSVKEEKSDEKNG
jgi:molecular chaperone IbpA